MKISSHFSAVTILLSCVTLSISTSVANAKPPFSSPSIPSVANLKTIEGTLKEGNGQNVGFIRCSDITVNFIRVTPVEGTNGIYPKKVLASAAGKGDTLGNSCVYTLSVRDLSAVSTVAKSYYVLEISAPRIDACYIAQSLSFSESINSPFPSKIDLEIGRFFTCPK